MNPFAVGGANHQNCRDVRYRRCVSCSALMNRRVFDRSGVILDICPTHGIWFDPGELDRILRWIRDGGKSRSEELERSRRMERTGLEGWALERSIIGRDTGSEFADFQEDREDLLHQIWRFLMGQA